MNARLPAPTHAAGDLARSIAATAIRLCALAACLLASTAPALRAQGFDALGSAAGDYALPQRGEGFTFPEDHGPHPDFRIEWWYVTANLEGPDATPYGVQWTLFRFALAPGGEADAGWSTPQAFMGHAALTTPEAHHATETLARGGIGQAGVTAEPFEAFIDDWTLAGPTLADVTMHAADADWSYDLALSADRPFVPQGKNGYSVKSAAGQASHYYSQPFYAVEGTLTLPGGESVPVTGQAWLDREWSSQPLAEDQDGWDWFSLHLGTGEKLMGYRLRGTEDYTVGTWIAPDGRPTPLPEGALSTEPLETTEIAGRDVPTRWRLTLPERDLDVEVSALNERAWMDLSTKYWEGPVTVSGSHEGRGYLEMTGY